MATSPKRYKFPIAAGAAILAVACSSGASPITGQGSWETTLLARDVNHDGTIDAYFDTALGITWLADAQPTTGDWASVRSYVSAFRLPTDTGSISGWRLPVTTIEGTGGCTSISAQWADCASTSEMAHLNYVTLGNSGYPNGVLNNTGPFGNLLTDSLNHSYYWSDTTDAANAPANAWAFYFNQGLQVTLDKRLQLSAMLVHDGDIGAEAVPEPASLALVGLALASITATRRRRQ